MKRINVLYDGQQYTIGERSLTEVQKQITDALASGVPSWLEVNLGEGAPHSGQILIHSGISITLSPIDEETPTPGHIPEIIDYTSWRGPDLL